MILVLVDDSWSFDPISGFGEGCWGRQVTQYHIKLCKDI